MAPLRIRSGAFILKNLLTYGYENIHAANVFLVVPVSAAMRIRQPVFCNGSLFFARMILAEELIGRKENIFLAVERPDGDPAIEIPT